MERNQTKTKNPTTLVGKLPVTKLLTAVNTGNPWPWLSERRVLKREHLIRYRSWIFLCVSELNMKSPWQPFF